MLDKALRSRKFLKNINRFFINRSLENNQMVDFQIFNRHANQVTLNQFTPNINPHSHVQPSSTIIGEVSISEDCFIGNNTVIKGDLNKVEISDWSIIMENCVINTLSKLTRNGKEASTILGLESMVFPNSVLTSCELELSVVIGANSIICEGSRIGNNSIIGPNSVVPPYRYIPANQLWSGNPVRFVKDVSRKEIATLRYLKQSMRDYLLHIKKNNLNINSAYKDKEVLDDMEMRMLMSDLNKSDIDDLITTLEENNLGHFFEKKLIDYAKSNLD